MYFLLPLQQNLHRLHVLLLNGVQECILKAIRALKLRLFSGVFLKRFPTDEMLKGLAPHAADSLS